MNPTALRDHLIAAGHMTETGATRRARVKPCRCGERIVVGLDDEVGAFEVRVDPQALNALGEALALLEGRRTVAARRVGARIVLDHRDDRSIAREPAETTEHQDVHRQHRCGTPAPAGIAITNSQLIRQRPAATEHPNF